MGLQFLQTSLSRSCRLSGLRLSTNRDLRTLESLKNGSKTVPKTPGKRETSFPLIPTTITGPRSKPLSQTDFLRPYIFMDGLAVDMLHDEVRKPLVARASIEKLGNERVIETG